MHLLGCPDAPSECFPWSFYRPRVKAKSVREHAPQDGRPEQAHSSHLRTRRLPGGNASLRPVIPFFREDGESADANGRSVRRHHGLSGHAFQAGLGRVEARLLLVERRPGVEVSVRNSNTKFHERRPYCGGGWSIA